MPCLDTKRSLDWSPKDLLDLQVFKLLPVVVSSGFLLSSKGKMSHSRLARLYITLCTKWSPSITAGFGFHELT